MDPRLGTWDDVRGLGAARAVMVDMIVNHVSADSPEFRDVVARGSNSPHMGLFLTMSDVYPDGPPEQIDAAWTGRSFAPCSTCSTCATSTWQSQGCCADQSAPGLSPRTRPIRCS